MPTTSFQQPCAAQGIFFKQAKDIVHIRSLVQRVIHKYRHDLPLVSEQGFSLSDFVINFMIMRFITFPENSPPNL